MGSDWYHLVDERATVCAACSLIKQGIVATRRNSALILLIAPSSALNGTHCTHRSTAVSRLKKPPALTGAPFYCVIGSPITHSKSPLIHRLFAEQFGLPLQYERVEVTPPEFVASVGDLYAAGCQGINVTVPNKSAAFMLGEVRGARAALAQAANTLWWDAEGRLVVDNTDGMGLVADLRRATNNGLPGTRILMLGAGGAAAGVIPALLAERPLSLSIANRTEQRARELATRFSELGVVVAMATDTHVDTPFDLVINATSASLSLELPGIPRGAVGRNTLCYDMVYATGSTCFLDWAQNLGVTAWCDGLGMLVEQAACAFNLWHHQRPDTVPVLAALQRMRSS